MEVLIKRTYFTTDSTVSQLLVDGVFQCWLLEDMDRGLDATMPLSKIKKDKVHGKTAVPVGRYEMVISFSARFQKLLPLLLNVPGYEGIRTHPGNSAEDTDGCQLPGTTKGVNFVGNSRAAFNALFKKLTAAIKKEKVYYTFVRDPAAWAAFTNR